MSINPDMLTPKGLEAIAQRSKAKRTGRPCVGAGDRTQAENEAERDELWESTLCEKREKAKDPFIVCAALGGTSTLRVRLYTTGSRSRTRRRPR